jgi:AGZA family xanthine/uracil permease-like MFS transporter
MLAGSLLGTSPVGAYVESSAGIAVGGRSGITAHQRTSRIKECY